MIFIKPLYLPSFLLYLPNSILTHVLTGIDALLPFLEIGLRLAVPFVLETRVSGVSDSRLLPFIRLRLLWKLCPRIPLQRGSVEAVRSRGCALFTMLKVHLAVLGLCALISL